MEAPAPVSFQQGSHGGEQAFMFPPPNISDKRLAAGGRGEAAGYRLSFDLENNCPTIQVRQMAVSSTQSAARYFGTATRHALFPGITAGRRCR
jgi:hypothetical protein